MTADHTPDEGLPPEPDSGPAPAVPEFDAMPLPLLITVLHEATRAMARRVATPGAMDELAPLASPDPGPHLKDWGATWYQPAEAEPPSAPVPDPEAVCHAEETAPGSVAPQAKGDHEVPFTLPLLNQALEAIGRSVTTAQMSLAGHTVQTYENPPERLRLLGIPEGKTAFRNAADYLKLSLRIDGSEAHRRARWAAQLRPRTTLTGEQLPPQWPLLSASVHDSRLDCMAVDVIASALGKALEMARRVQADPQAVEDLLEDGEERLVAQGECSDPGTVRKVAQHWLTWFEAAVDPDGAEPNDADLPEVQGMVRKGRRNGLHHWLLSVNDEQNEYLLTIANAATNPRRNQFRCRDAEDNTRGPAAGAAEDLLTVEVVSETDGTLTTVPDSDPRTRSQLQLDGLMACLASGLSLVESDQLPSTGGTRPQIAVTIDFQTLSRTLAAAGASTAGPGTAGHAPSTAHTAADLRQFESSTAFTGSIHPSTIRAMACHADIVPVVLGADSEILDVGRTQRLFPARLRQAISARDGGCSAPGCWIPAPWCEVHHVDHWEHGGRTSTDNGTLLCNHHHHAVHAGAWEIDMGSGRPWFIPAPYLDPRRRPQRNRYWRR